jgi:putative endonuclease
VNDAQSAEDLVAEHLRSEGWEIRARNWRRRGCELDIVALRQQILAVIEVKFRRTFRPYAAELALLLDPPKIAAIRRGALLFLAANSLSEVHTIRCDLAVVTCYRQNRTHNAKDQELKIHYYNNIIAL